MIVGSWEVTIATEELRAPGGPLRPAPELPALVAALESALDAVPDAVLVVDDTGVVVVANRAVRSVFGYRPSRLVGRPLTDLLPGGLQAVLAGDAHRPARRRDETSFSAQISLSSLPVAGGVYHTVVVREASEDCRRSERHLLMSQRVARVGSWEHDEVTGRLQWSAELYRILGVEPGAVEPRLDTLYRHVHPDDRPMLVTEYRRLLADGGQLFAVVRAAVGPPRTFAVRGLLERDEDGALLRSLGTVQDITEETLARQGRDSSAATFREAFDLSLVGAAPLGMALLDVRPGRPIRRLMANQALGELMGLSPAQLLVEPLEERVHPEDRPAYRALLGQIASGARDVVQSLQVRVVRPDGTQRWAAVSGHLVRDGDGVPEHVVAHVEDISERKQAELEAGERAARDARIAAVLQDNLLPFVSAQVGPVRVANRYLPAGDGARVGGDWTDVFILPNGCVGLVVGDVEGCGIEAAVTMTRLRAAVRMLAASGLGPAGVLRRLNAAMHETDISADVDLATLVHAQLDPRTGRMLYSSAGHLPMMLVPAGTGADGPRVVVPVPAIGGPPIGVVPDLRYQEQSIAVDADSFLVGYTDGLVERRGHDLHESLLALQTALSGLPARTLTSVEAVADAVLRLAPGGVRDDLAVVVLALRPNEVEAAAAGAPAGYRCAT